MFDPEMRVTPEVQQLLKKISDLVYQASREKNIRIICKDPLMFKRIDMGILL